MICYCGLIYKRLIWGKGQPLNPTLCLCNCNVAVYLYACGNPWCGNVAHVHIQSLFLPLSSQVWLVLNMIPATHFTNVLWSHNPYKKNIWKKLWSDQITVLHMPWQLSCHGMCKIVIWFNLFNQNHNKITFWDFIYKLPNCCEMSPWCHCMRLLLEIPCHAADWVHNF